MKLLISLSYYFPHISGLTLSMRNLAEGLAESDMSVSVLAAQHDERLPFEEDIQKVAVIRVPYLFRLNKGFVMPGFFKTAIRVLKKNDAVLITMPQAQSLSVAIAAKLLKKKIYCFYICEVIVPGGFGAKIINFGILLVNKSTLLFADQVVTLTDDFAKNNKVLRQSGKKVTGIFPVVIPPKIDAAEQTMLQHKLPHKKYYIGFLGRIASEKGITYLLQTIPLLQKEFGNDFVIVLAGPEKTVGEEAYQKQIETLFHRYSDFVFQAGELTDAQLGAFYSMLDVFILPSTNNTEAFGMVQVEAMYCRTPVVATDLPGVRVPIQETGMGEIVPPKNVEALAQAIVTVLKNKKHYIKERSIIENVFSKEKIIKAYQDLLEA